MRPIQRGNAVGSISFSDGTIHAVQGLHDRRGDESSMYVQQTELLRLGAFGLAVTVVSTVLSVNHAVAQSPSGDLHVDPQTGDLYRRTTSTVYQPVVDERLERRDQTVYRPETVVETRPELRTTYTPVTQMRWMPYVEGRWNPFRQPTVAYRQVPETRWEARSEVVNRTTSQTRYVAERRTVEIPHRTVRYQAKQQTNVELVAKALPQPQVDPAGSVDPQIASRLRPLEPVGSGSAPAVAIASNTVGRMTSDPPGRTAMQTGMRTNVLSPTNTVGTPLPPVVSPVGVATVPSFSVWR